MKGKSNIGVIIAVLVILGVLTGYITLPKGTGQTQSILGGPGASATPGLAPSTSVDTACGLDKQADLQVRARTALDAGASYTNMTTMYVAEYPSNKQIVTVTTPTNGAYATYPNILSCGKSYKLFVTDSTSFVATSSPVFVANSDTMTQEIVVANASQVELQVLNGDTSANETAGYIQDGITNITTALAIGGISQKLVLYRAKTGTAQFGSDELNTYVCADFPLATYSTTNGITVDRSDWVSVPLPRGCSDNSFDKAWKTPPVKSIDGARRVLVSFRADLAEPTSSTANPRLRWFDEHYYLGSDGTIKAGSSNDVSTLVGSTDRYIDFSFS